jgi:hypothetical protein
MAATVGVGGLGGGGLHLVALKSISIAATGRIDLNGNGGAGVGTFRFAQIPAGGAGSGGTLVVESPTVTVSAGAIAAANGGGGAGGCIKCSGDIILICSHVNGQSGQMSAVRAIGGRCSGGGNGGDAAIATSDVGANGQGSDSAGNTAGGGGGGSDGIIILRARDGAHLQIAGEAIVSPAPTKGTVVTN